MFSFDYFGRKAYLNQSQQLYKQTMMAAGFEKVYEIGPSFRAEKSHTQRHVTEFTQLDLEMSFVEQEDVLAYTEDMFIELVKTLYPDKKISVTPFPRFTFAEVMEKYGTDKPDLRKDKNNPDELAFAWITDFPMFEKKEDGSIAAAHHPFCSIKPEDKKEVSDTDLEYVRVKKESAQESESDQDIISAIA